MADRNDREHFREVPEQFMNYPGKGSEHLARGFDNCPYHVKPADLPQGHWPPSDHRSPGKGCNPGEGG